MKKIKGLQTYLSALSMAAILIAVSSCIGDQGVSKSRGLVKDFSKNSTNKNGCAEKFLVFKTPDTCTTACAEKTHLATATELSEVKTKLVADGNTTLLTIVNGSANICLDDVVVESRPTNQIDIKSDFCSCLAGASDVINDCTSFCALRPATDTPTLYVNTIMGTDIALNSKLGNLHNWCTVQLLNDETNPQCVLNATDGTNTVNISVTTTPGSNSFTANILPLAKDRTWILKLVESKTGSAAQSKEFQLRRTSPPSTDTNIVGALKVAPVSQYTCMTYGIGVVAGKISRTSYARLFYYFAANETPPPIPPTGGSTQSAIVCHDEQLHPGDDSALYPRLELIPNGIAMWDKTDPRFVAKAANGGKITINKILEDRLASEYKINGASISLFTLISYPNRPSNVSTSTANIPLGYMMIPFTNSDTGKTYCPTSTDFTGNQPLLNLLGEYMDDTEGLFLGEKEAEVVNDNGVFKTLYGTMFVRESTLKDYGFYIENGLKIKANAASMHTKTIYYYWPTSTTADALTQGNRKLFTVRNLNALSGNIPTGQQTNEATTDKRIGCIPKS